MVWPQCLHVASGADSGTWTRRRQRGHCATASTGRTGSRGTGQPHVHVAWSWPGGTAAALPQRGQGRSGASTKRTAAPHEGQWVRCASVRGIGAPQWGHGVVATGRPSRGRS